MADAEVPIQNGVAEDHAAKPEEEVEQDTVLVKKFIELETIQNGEAEKPKEEQVQPAGVDDDKTEDQVSDIFSKDVPDPMTASVYGVEDLPKEEAPKDAEKPAEQNGDVEVAVFVGSKPEEAAAEEKPKEEEPEVAFSFNASATAAPATPSATSQGEQNGDVAVEVLLGGKPEEAAAPGTPSAIAGSAVGSVPGTPKVDSSVPESPKPTSAVGSVPGTPRSVIAAEEKPAEEKPAEETKPSTEPTEFVDEERERIKLIEKWARSDKPEPKEEEPEKPAEEEAKPAEEEKKDEGDVSVEVFEGTKEEAPAAADEKTEEEPKPSAEPAEFIDEERERIKMMERWARSDRAEEEPPKTPKTPVEEAPKTPVSEPKTPVEEAPKTPVSDPKSPVEEAAKPAEKEEEVPRTPVRTRRESPSPPRRSPPRREAEPSGTRLTTATSFSDWVPKEPVTHYSARQYIPGASHRTWEYQSWFGAVPGGSLSAAYRLIERSRSRSIERRREMDFRRSPSAGSYGRYYGNYWSGYQSQFSFFPRTREYSVSRSLSRGPSFVSFRDYRDETKYNLARTTSSDLLSRSSSRDRDDVKQWNGVGHFSPVNLYASNLHTHYTSHVPSSYGIYGSSYGSNLYRSSSYSSFRMPFSYRSRTGVYALYHRYY